MSSVIVAGSGMLDTTTGTFVTPLLTDGGSSREFVGNEYTMKGRGTPGPAENDAVVPD
jgi:hypothetical protein